MKNFIVLYRLESIMCPVDSPFGFQCWADDADHAEEQCFNAYPGCDVVWVWQGQEGVGMQAALDDYWNLDSDDEMITAGVVEPRRSNADLQTPGQLQDKWDRLGGLHMP